MASTRNPDDLKGLTSVWSLEQETLPGYFVETAEDSDNGSTQVKTKFKVRAVTRVKEEAPDWGIPKSELFVEVVKRSEKHLLRNYEQKLQVPFVGCGLKVNPVYILRPSRSLSAELHWTKKCGSEKGTDSGEYFICPDCALIFGYRW